MTTLAFLFFILSAIFLGIDSFMATAVGRVRFLSLGLFFMALGFVFSHWLMITVR